MNPLRTPGQWTLPCGAQASPGLRWLARLVWALSALMAGAGLIAAWLDVGLWQGMGWPAVLWTLAVGLLLRPMRRMALALWRDADPITLQWTGPLRPPTAPPVSVHRTPSQALAPQLGGWWVPSWRSPVRIHCLLDAQTGLCLRITELGPKASVAREHLSWLPDPGQDAAVHALRLLLNLPLEHTAHRTVPAMPARRDAAL